jgi:hypothetical protein
VYQLNNRLSYRLFLSRSSVKQHKGSYRTSRAYHTNVKSPWPTNLLQCLHWYVPTSCILRLIGPSPLCTAGTPYWRHKTIFFPLSPWSVVYHVFLKARRKELAKARTFLTHCKLTPYFAAISLLRNWFLSPATRVLLYKTLIWPIVAYG